MMKIPQYILDLAWRITPDVLKAGFQALFMKNGDGLQGVVWDVCTCASNCACSEGCLHCPIFLNSVKERMKNKNKNVVPFAAKFLTDNLMNPVRLKTAQVVFVGPRGDLFHKDIRTEDIAKTMAVIDNCPELCFSLLTKRATRMKKLFSSDEFWKQVEEEGKDLFGPEYTLRKNYGSNVLVGVTIESQKYMHRAEIFPFLPRTMTRVIFVAPMIGPVTLSAVAISEVQWVVQSKEMGGGDIGARPCDDLWVQDLHGQCQAAGIPFYTQDKWTPQLMVRLGPKYREFPRHKFFQAA
jgi:protein gp37